MKSEFRKEINEISERVLSEIIADVRNDDGDIRSAIEERVFRLEGEYPYNHLVESIDRISGRIGGALGELSYLLDDETINEIMANGPTDIFIEKNGSIERVNDEFESVEALEKVIRRIAASVHREVSELDPILDARLEDGSRVNAVMKNIAAGGPALTIRKFSKTRISMSEMLNAGCLSTECMEDLRDLVRAGMNIFISGGTSSGKTTFLNALAEYIPDTERVITVEDSLELQLINTENLVRLECRNANAVGRGGIDMKSLIKASLRMRPDRIIVGEVRGDEVADMLQALNTGHSGMSTGHSNSVSGMLSRLEAMYLSASDIPADSIRIQISQAVDIMLHMSRGNGGKRRITEIQELYGYENGSFRLNPLYMLDENLELKRSGNRLVNDIKLRLRGIRNERLQGKN